MDRMKSNLTSRRGSSIVEFAIVAFVLLMVVFGVFEFCRMALVYANLANASRVAVRYAITHGVDRTNACNASAGCGSTDGTATSSDICGTSGVLTSFAKGPLDTSKLSCTYSGLGGGVGTTVRVNVSYAYDPWFNIVPYKVTLSSTSQGVITY
jgi:Flp pilus assembly protein TadG